MKSGGKLSRLSIHFYGSLTLAVFFDASPLLISPSAPLQSSIREAMRAFDLNEHESIVPVRH
jgi:hypothetical protein